jgi:hypothetical protein
MVWGNLFKTKVEAHILAKDLFRVWVMDDLETKYEDNIREWRNYDNFDEAKCRYALYVYLVSVVAVALTAIAEKSPEFKGVIHSFREHASSAVKKFWNIQNERFDQEVEGAANNLAPLFFTHPSENRGLSLEWSRGWLAGFGVNKYNPISLFNLTFRWKNSFLHLCRLLNKFRVI